MGLLIRDRHALLRRAFVASLGLHLLAAAMIPIWAARQSTIEPIESLTFARLTHVRIEHPALRARTPAVPRTTHHAAAVRFSHVRAELSSNHPKPHAPPKPRSGPLGHVAALKHTLTPAVSVNAPANTGPIAPAPAPSVAPQTPVPQATVGERVAQTFGSSDRGGVLPLGAEQDPVLDPSVREQLAKRFNVRVTLIVTVGDNGRTKRVVFQPPIDPQTERAIEDVLAAANWDAAVCGGGINCEGTATIKL